MPNRIKSVFHTNQSQPVHGHESFCSIRHVVNTLLKLYVHSLGLAYTHTLLSKINTKWFIDDCSSATEIPKKMGTKHILQ